MEPVVPGVVGELWRQGRASCRRLVEGGCDLGRWSQVVELLKRKRRMWVRRQLREGFVVEPDQERRIHLGEELCLG